MNEQSLKLGEIVDLTHYPITFVGTPEYEDLIARCQASLVEKGALRLNGFVKPEAIERMASEAAALSGEAYQQNDQFTAYIGDEVPDNLPEDHPRRLMQRTAQAAVAWDMIPPAAAPRVFYEADELTNFIADVMGKTTLYRSADPLAACNLAYIKDGDELGWHFDSSEFSVTLQIQAPETGGVFEFVPFTRNAQDQNYDKVRDVLLGSDEGVRKSPCEAGVLSIFKGHDALHRVTSVEGPKPRVTAVLTYAETPDFRVSDQSKRLFYGRLA